MGFENWGLGFRASGHVTFLVLESACAQKILWNLPTTNLYHALGTVTAGAAKPEMACIGLHYEPTDQLKLWALYLSPYEGT